MAKSVGKIVRKVARKAVRPAVRAWGIPSASSGSFASRQAKKTKAIKARRVASMVKGAAEVKAEWAAKKVAKKQLAKSRKDVRAGVRSQSAKFKSSLQLRRARSRPVAAKAAVRTAFPALKTREHAGQMRKAAAMQIRAHRAKTGARGLKSVPSRKPVLHFHARNLGGGKTGLTAMKPGTSLAGKRVRYFKMSRHGGKTSFQHLGTHDNSPRPAKRVVPRGKAVTGNRPVPINSKSPLYRPKTQITRIATHGDRRVAAGIATVQRSLKQKARSFRHGLKFATSGHNLRGMARAAASPLQTAKNLLR